MVQPGSTKSLPSPVEAGRAAGRSAGAKNGAPPSAAFSFCDKYTSTPDGLDLRLGAQRRVSHAWRSSGARTSGM
eukprot:scaffold5089_cov127-Isochrysis_galbana.AAC.5